MMVRSHRFVFVITLGVILVAALHAQTITTEAGGAGSIKDQSPAFRGLGFLPGYNLSDALSVSADGSVVAGYVTTSDKAQAFRWTANTGIVGLGVLPGHSYSYAWAVSSDGSAVVGES